MHVARLRRRPAARPEPDSASADSATPDSATADSATTDTGPALEVDPGPQCAAIGGIYRVAGQCNGEASRVEPILCIAQTACNAVTWITAETRSTLVVGGPGWAANGDNWRDGCEGLLTSDGFTFDCLDDSFLSPLHCSGTATRLAVPGATRFCCDVGRQDCAADERCAVVHVDDAGRIASACVPRTADLAEGAACTVPDGIGTDGCAVGLTCSDLGSASAATTCQRQCAKRADCAPDEACAFARGDSAASVDVGVCRPTCDIMAPDCASGTSCTLRFEAGGDVDGSGITAICDRPGTLAEDSACRSFEACGPDLSCGIRFGAVCARPCRADADCSEGRECGQTDYYSSAELTGVGFCYASE